MTRRVESGHGVAAIMGLVLAGLAAACAPAAQTPAAIADTPDTPFKLATVEAGGAVRLAMVLGDQVVDIAGANAHLEEEAGLSATTLPTEMMALIDAYDTASPRLYQIANYMAAGAPADLPFVFAADAVTFQAPIQYPWNLFSVAANYRLHAEGMAQEEDTDAAAGDEAPPRRGGFDASVISQIDPDRDAPVVFAKSARSGIIGTGEPYYIPPGRTRIDWEGEVAVVIGEPARLVTTADALDHVFGYSILYDVSDRGGPPRREISMFPGPNWLEGKSLDRGAPFGPVIVPKEFIDDPANLDITTRVNGEVMQDANTNQLIWDDAHLVSYLSQIMTLYPGDVIATGTPAGTGAERQQFLSPGDVVEIEVEGIGTLRTPIEDYPGSAMGTN